MSQDRVETRLPPSLTLLIPSPSPHIPAPLPSLPLPQPPCCLGDPTYEPPTTSVPPKFRLCMRRSGGTFGCFSGWVGSGVQGGAAVTEP